MRSIICFGFLLFLGTTSITVSAQTSRGVEKATTENATIDAEAIEARDLGVNVGQPTESWGESNIVTTIEQPIDLGTPKEMSSSDGRMELLFGAGTLKASGTVSILTVNGTQRAFVPWSPLFLLPPSPFGLDTSTF